MRRLLSVFILIVVVLAGLGAQEQLPEMGMALRLNDREGRLFVSHRNYPYGTRVKIINLLNGADLELNVEGTPNNAWAHVELSALAADFLGIPAGVYNQIRLEVLAVPTATPAMRPRTASVTQTGNAVVQASGEGLTASHPSIPIGRSVNLTNTSNGRTVVVTITGRAQAARERIIEISPAAGRSLDIRGSGQVRLATQ